MTKYAFRCKNCGHLEIAAQAGEREYPGACRVCGHGVVFDPLTGVKSYEDAANWLVLADASQAELDKVFKHHAIDHKDIEAHKPSPASDPGHVPQTLHITADDSQTSEDHA